MSATSSIASTENGRWVDNSIAASPGGLICKDFLPQPDPDQSTCCTTTYQSFSETVQQANEWLARYEKAEVVNCETLPFSFTGSQAFLPDSWPTTTHLRGLRVWIRLPEESGHEGRCLLSFRDYAPYLDRKNRFSRDYDDATVLMERLNGYLATRITPSRIVSVQTVDTPMSGVVEMDVDTDKSRLAFSQHGYTMYCRTLRVFFVTHYHRNSMQVSLTRSKLGLRDFLPKAKSDGPSRRGETLSDVMQRAVAWCHSTPGVTLLNLQVLPLKSGRPSVATTWTLESPGHLPNKFTSFVRLIFTDHTDGKADRKADGEAEKQDEVADVITSMSPSRASTEEADKLEQEDMKSSRVTLPPLIIEKQNEEDSKADDKESRLSLKDVSSLPGVINVAEAGETKSKVVSGLRFKTFVPKLASSPIGVCGRGQWEPVDQTVNRLNSWVYTSQGTLLTIHTQLVFTRGRRDEVDADTVRWARHLAGAGHVGVFHLVMNGGRCTTAFPPAMSDDSSSCVIL
ncbi:uncharacterized protein LOC123510530 isoform X2 [Portunus trituberculatus]|uniref:uncharacterized protein LOC123510530 isoform X2 n=1 Tax=Portunus trituberculatus TaxID=210409 RepID=UPI001E1CFFAC|nr:uncharacterized protein LOC123510530 isoform X2 [Portunus trituberculatus]